MAQLSSSKVYGDLYVTGDSTVEGSLNSPEFIGELVGNAGSATKLATARNINGVSFDGTKNITITASTPGTLTRGSYLTGSSFNGSTARTWAVDATSANTASKVVARDASGNFSAGTITATLSGNASSATKVNNKLTLKFDTGTTENTNLYTYDGSADKTIDIKAGSNVSLTKAANTITISSTNTNTTYSTGTLAQLKAGTDTTGRLQTAKLLNEWIDSKGYITSYVDTTYTAGTNIQISSNNVISATDTKYSLPTASSTTLGGIKVGSNLSISSGVLSATNTTYSNATPSSSGLMSRLDKSKLNGIASNANNYSHPTDDGYLHVPVTGTTNNGKVLKAGSTAGSIAWGTLSYSDVGAASSGHTHSGYASSSHTHAAGDITTGTFAIARIPTGSTSSTVALGSHTHTVRNITSVTGKSLIGRYSTTTGIAQQISLGDGLTLNSSGVLSATVPSHTHSASDITSGTFAIARIPTGTTSSTVALGNHTHSGYASSSHTHAAGDITSGTFAIARIPTGTTSSTVALGNHTHSGYASSSHTHSNYVDTSSTQSIGGQKTFSDTITVNGISGSGNISLSGNISIQGTVTSAGFFQNSDIRLKNVIEPLEINIKDILNIPSFYFTYKDKERINIGTSAQEVQKVFPEIVNTDSKGMLSVEYDKFGLIALELIKTQQKEIDSLKYELNNLKLKIDGYRN